jgi:hypothetical protein
MSCRYSSVRFLPQHTFKPLCFSHTIGWESLAAHQEFTKTPEFEPFLQQLGSLMGGAPTQFHVKLPETPSLPPNPFQAPVTECLNAYFAPEQDEDAWLKESWGGTIEQAKEQQGVKWLGMFECSI